MEQSPLISVLLPVYNAEKYLAESIQSILNQTYSNFEFIILNDGSKDNSEEVILSFNDQRIRYYKHDNCGLAATLNRGIELSQGKYIARQDQDDISLPERFEKQLKYMEGNPDTVLLGTRARIFTDDLNTYGYHNHPSNPAIIMFDLMFNNPFVHSSVFIRKETLTKTGVYTINKGFYEDFHLWSRLVMVGKLTNLEEVLVEYRHHEKSLSKGGSYFANDALYSQCVLNIETLLNQSNQIIKDLPALIHSELPRYKGSSRKQLFETLKQIEISILKKYPGNETVLTSRRKDYESMLRSALFAFRLNLNKNNKFKYFLIRVENKLQHLFS